MHPSTMSPQRAASELPAAPPPTPPAAPRSSRAHLPEGTAALGRGSGADLDGIVERSLERRVALVTDAGGELGRAVALALARAGARLALLHAAGSGHGVLRRDAPRPVDPDVELERTRRQVVSGGGRAIVLPGDPSGTECCLEAVRRTVKLWGSVDIVVVDASDRRFADAGPLLRAVRPYLGRGATLASVVRAPTDAGSPAGTALVEHASRSMIPAGSTRATLDALERAGLPASAGAVPDGRWPFDASAPDAGALRGLGRHALSLADGRSATIASCLLRLATADARWMEAGRRPAGTVGGARGP